MADKQKRRKRPDGRPCRKTQWDRTTRNKARRILRNHNHGCLSERARKANSLLLCSLAAEKEESARFALGLALPPIKPAA